MSTETQTQADLMKRIGNRVVAEVINGRNVDVMDELYSPKTVWHGPGGREIRGLEGLKEMVSGYHTAFPDLRMTIEHQVAEGSHLAVEWRVKGTHRGPLQEIAPTGRKVDIRGHIVSRFERGRVVEEFEVWDELEMLRQIGVIDR